MCLRCFAVALHYARPAQDAISASVPIARLTDEREREIVEALRTVGDKASRVVRSMLLKHQSMPSSVGRESIWLSKSEAIMASLNRTPTVRATNVHSEMQRI